MTDMEAFENRLGDIISRIERLTVEQKVVNPKREKEVDELLREARSVFEEFGEWRRRQRDDERFARALDAMTKSLAASYERLAASEARLAQALEDRDGFGFEVDEELLEEGEFLLAELAGPPTPGLQLRYLKDAPRRDYVPGLDGLRRAMGRPAAGAMSYAD